MHRLPTLLFCLLASGCLAVTGDDDDSIEAPVLCADFDGCDANANCTDSDAGPVCACGDGWDGDGLTCTDVDECAVDNGGCSENATCANTDGSFTCACDDGWAGDGFVCQDVDECAVDNGGCDLNATCTNSDGSFECACNEGWEGDGFDCTEVLPYWELVDTLTVDWSTNWYPDTVVVYDGTIVWGSSEADGNDARLYQWDPLGNTYMEIAGGTQDLCACGLTEAAALLGDELYLFGNTGQYIDLSNLALGWQSAFIPFERRVGEAGAVGFEGRVYTFGGRGPLKTCQSYSGGAAGTWMDHAEIPYPIDYGRPVAYDGDIYLLGGVNEGANNSRASVYDPVQDSWTILPDPPTDDARTVSAGVYGSQLYMFQQGDLYFFDVATSTWVDPVAGPGLQGAHALTISGQIHAIGAGDTGATEVHRLVFP